MAESIEDLPTLQPMRKRCAGTAIRKGSTGSWRCATLNRLLGKVDIRTSDTSHHHSVFKQTH